MEGQQHTNTSRLTEWQQEQSLSQANPQQLTLSHHPVSEQSKKLKHIPMSKLSLNYIFIKKQHQKHLYKQHLQQKNKSVHNYFYQMRQNFQNDIYEFMKKYESMSDGIDEQQSVDHSVSEISSQYLIRQNTGEEYSSKGIRKMTEGSISSPSRSKESSKRVSEGGYFWNNWRSYENYPCMKAINENTVIPATNQTSISNAQSETSAQNLNAHLVYAVIDMDFDRAMKIIDSISDQSTYDHEQQQSNKPSELTSSIHGSKHVKEVVVVSRGDNKHASKQNNNTKSIATKNSVKNNLKQQKENSLNLKSLRIIIKGLKTLSSLIKFTDELNNNSQLSETFFYRDQFHLLEDHYLNDPKAKINLLNISIQQIQNSGYFRETLQAGLIEECVENGVKDRKKFDKKPSYNPRPQSPKGQRKTLKSTQNLMNFKNSPKKPKCMEQLRSFLELKSKYQKICILNNLMFIINFAKKIRIQNCENDYFKLLFCYLKNGHDQMMQGLTCEIEGHKYSYTEKQKNSDDFNKLSPLLQQEESDNLSQSSFYNRAVAVNYRQQIDYLSLLLSLENILIFDRINFAARLLSKHKKFKFTQQIQSRIIQLPFIDNLLLFTKSYKEEIRKSPQDEISCIDYIKSSRDSLSNHNRLRKNSIDGFQKWSTSHQIHQKQRSLVVKHKNQQQQQQGLQTLDVLANKIKAICQNYIDQSGDLSTVAYLAIEYECLERYFDCYRESLLLSFEQNEVQKLDAMKQDTRGEQWTDKRTYLTRKYVPFLLQANFRQEKVNQNFHQEIMEMIDSRRCEICSLKIFPDKRECYIECSKCRHGGHFEHIIKWYNSYQNCPNVNCACVCN